MFKYILAYLSTLPISVSTYRIKRVIFNDLFKVNPRSSASKVLFNRKKCFENMQEIYRGTPMPKCDFNKVEKQFS